MPREENQPPVLALSSNQKLKVSLVFGNYFVEIVLDTGVSGNSTPELASIHMRIIDLSMPENQGSRITTPRELLSNEFPFLVSSDLENQTTWNALSHYANGQINVFGGENRVIGYIANDAIPNIEGQEIDPIEWDELWIEEIRINTLPALFMK